MRVCYRCKQPGERVGKRELRPYGPGGADICAGCMFGEGGRAPDPEIQAEAARQCGAAMDGVVATGHAPMVGAGFDDGPLPAPDGKVNA